MQTKEALKMAISYIKGDKAWVHLQDEVLATCKEALQSKGEKHMKHKWHDEICAWADGAEIEYRFKDTLRGWGDWELNEDGRFLTDSWWEYRIKPTPKEPQYLYVYSDVNAITFSQNDFASIEGRLQIGKIKLEVDDA